MAVKKDKKVIVFPEVVEASRRDHEGEVKKWQVIEGTTARGDHSSDLAQRVMRVPLVNDEVARVVRMYELTKSKVAPKSEEEANAFTWYAKVTPKAIQASEEFRVGQVVRNLGYDTDLLKDGSEKATGERLAEAGTNEAWNKAVSLATAMSGTKAFTPLMAGLKAGGKPEWATKLRDLQKALKREVKWQDNSRLADSDPYTLTYTEGGSSVERSVTTTYGFAFSANRLARIVENYLQDPIGQPDRQGQDLTGASDVAVPVGTGANEYAPLIFDETVRCDQQVKGFLHRKKVKSPSGKRVLYPSRVLTDPQKRVFGSKAKTSGGVLVIDYSGSMSLTEADVDRLVDLAPSCLVIAYSQRNNSDYRTPNAWVLADRGKRVSEFPKSMRSAGNGVDGSALLYGLKHRKSQTEPVIWVSDGEAIAGNGGWSEGLGKVTAELIYKHRIGWAYNVEEAMKLLVSPNRNRRPRKVYGRVGRAYREHYDKTVEVGH